MLNKELGATGVWIPEIGIGTYAYQSGPEVLRRGLESGAVFIDTAESYGTERVVGQAVRGMRDRVFIATKVSPEHFRAADLRKSVDASLLNLGVDTVDLIQLHHPNPEIPIEETMGALAQLADAGKVRFCGVSNFSVLQLRDAQRALGDKHAVVSNQVRYNITDRTIEGDLLPYCRAHRITVIAYSPFAKSLSRILDCDPRGTISEIARNIGKSPAQIVLNWCLCQDGVVTIPKGGTVEHILENCGASDWRLSAEQIRLLDTNIRYRRRNRFDHIVRHALPSPLQRAGLRVLKALPPGIRRRFL